MDCGDNEPPSVRSCRQKSGIFTKHFTNGIPGGKASREFIFDKTECSDENQSSDGCSSCFTTSDDDSLGSFVVSDSDTLVFDSDDDSDSSHMPVVKARRSGRIYSDSESETEEKKTLSPTYIISDAESDEIKEMETNSIPKIPTLHALSEESHTQTGRRTVSKHSPTGTTMATSLNQMRLKDDTIIILLSLRPREEYHKAAEELGIKVFALDAVEVIERITGPRTLSAINEALHEMSLNQVSRYLKMAEKRKPILLDFCPIRTIAVEGLYGFYNGELTGRDITGYKLDWEHEWLPLLEETGYNIVVLADMADASAKVTQLHEGERNTGLDYQQVSLKKKHFCLYAIADYHASMLAMNVNSHNEGTASFKQKILDVYGFNYPCFWADGQDTVAMALKRALPRH